MNSARASGVMFTPTFFINGRRYDGPWDASSLSDAMLGTFGHTPARGGAGLRELGPSAGVLLLLATLAAVALTNSPSGRPFKRSGHQELSLTLGAAAFRMTLQHLVTDGLLTMFFLVVGLEIKHEFTVGHWRADAPRRCPLRPRSAA